MDGNTLAFIIALIKKYSSKDTSSGGSIDNDVDLMKISDYDKNKNGSVDIADLSNKSIIAEIALNSKKLGGELPENFFNKVTNNTDNIVEGGINKFVTRDEKETLKSLPNIINEVDNLGDYIESLKREIKEIKLANKDILDKLKETGSVPNSDSKDINTTIET